MVDGSSFVGCCLTESQSRGCRNCSRRRTTSRSLEWLVVAAGCWAGEEMIAGSRLRGSRLMRKSVLIATTRRKVYQQLRIANDSASNGQAYAKVYLRRPLSVSPGKTPCHHPSRRTCRPRTEHGRLKPVDSRSTPSCFGPHGIVYASSGTLIDEELS